MIKSVHIGNVKNPLMISVPDKEHSRPLVEATIRTIWYAQPSDIVLTQSRVPEYLKIYSKKLLERDGDVPECHILPKTKLGLISLLKSLGVGPGDILRPYALEPHIFDTANTLDLDIEHFTSPPAKHVPDLVMDLNSKSRFRELARSLDVPLASGDVVECANDLESYARAYLERFGAFILKLDRSSNGFGSLVCLAQELEALPTILANHLERYPRQPHRFVIEEFCEFIARPSIEICVSENGIEVEYFCDQRADPEGGLITPPDTLPTSVAVTYSKFGRKIAQWLLERGFCGIFDLDGGVREDGSVVFSEINVRRTSGSHLHMLALKLLGPSYTDHSVWISGHIAPVGFESLAAVTEALEGAGLGFCKSKREGMILTAISPDVSQVSYMVMARNHKHAARIEREFAEICLSRRSSIVSTKTD